MKILPPATSKVFEKLKTFTLLAAATLPTATADSENNGPIMAHL